MIRTIVRRAVLCLGAAFSLLGALFVAGAVLLPVSDGAPVANTQRIYVLSNGFHSDIALPVSAAPTLGIDLADFPVERDAIAYLAIGWGSVTAYTSLRAVSDLTMGIVAKAVAFDETVVHVLPTGVLAARDGIYVLELSQAQLDALTANIAQDFASTVPIAGLSQGFGDLFYDGRGRFSLWRTCNTWTGGHLRAVGVPVGFWTPSAWSLEYGLKKLSPRS